MEYKIIMSWTIKSSWAEHAPSGGEFFDTSRSNKQRKRNSDYIVSKLQKLTFPRTLLGILFSTANTFFNLGSVSFWRRGRSFHRWCSPLAWLKSESQLNNISINLTLDRFLEELVGHLLFNKKRQNKHRVECIHHPCKEEPSQHHLSSWIQYIHSHEEG